MKISIYCLLENKKPIYIGKTKNNLIQRKRQHENRLNKKLEIILLDLVIEEDWKFWECYWIEQFRVWGFELINKNNGGGGLNKHKEKTKIKMRGIKHPGTSQKLKGIKRPDISILMKGKKFSKITCDKISKSKKNHKCYQNPLRTEKIINSNKKHYKDGSTRNRKISEKLKGLKRTKEIKKNMSCPILQYDLEGNFIKEWESITKAINYTGYKGIPNCIKGTTKKSGGYIWKYKNPKEYQTKIKVEDQKIILELIKKHSFKYIINIFPYSEYELRYFIKSI